MHNTHGCSFARTASGRLITAGVLLMLVLPVLAASPELLGPGDTIRITVFQNPDLTTEARISSRGTITFPLIGEIGLDDNTPTEAGERIAEQLKKGGYILDPQVNVSLVDVRSRRISVLGHVSRPGQYALDGARMRLTDVLALAGGISPNGDDTVIVMTTRGGELERIDVDVPEMYRSGDLSWDIELQSGDKLFVPSAPVFYVYGAVQRAGAYRLEPDTSVLNALSLGGGLSPRGSERGIKIHRRMQDGRVRELDAELTDAVKPNDVIHVKESLF